MRTASPSPAPPTRCIGALARWVRTLTTGAARRAIALLNCKEPIEIRIELSGACCSGAPARTVGLYVYMTVLRIVLYLAGDTLAPKAVADHVLLGAAVYSMLCTEALAVLCPLLLHAKAAPTASRQIGPLEVFNQVSPPGTHPVSARGAHETLPPVSVAPLSIGERCRLECLMGLEGRNGTPLTAVCARGAWERPCGGSLS